ncbi:hypothetical protein SLEP1_g18118 [Rubroshorea leprosula]|uniref:Uncharacterized protein n=1 Tax=Rubroshorea leprosula TaxID=152421 RepID=A0AAV5J025_9ROSI|nr:hypothetical protein SLEP1_g18118 [Rubroshorea leprosula]
MGNCWAIVSWLQLNFSCEGKVGATSEMTTDKKTITDCMECLCPAADCMLCQRSVFSDLSMATN